MTVVFSYLALATLVATYTLRIKLIAVDGWSCVKQYRIYFRYIPGLYACIYLDSTNAVSDDSFRNGDIQYYFRESLV